MDAFLQYARAAKADLNLARRFPDKLQEMAKLPSKPLVEELEGRFQNGSTQDKISLLALAGAIKSDDSERFLINIASKDQGPVKLAAITGLTNFASDPKVENIMREFLRSDEPGVAYFAACVVPSDPQAVMILEDAAKDSKLPQELRLQAVYAIGHGQTKTGIQSIKRLLRASDPAVRDAAKFEYDRYKRIRFTKGIPDTRMQ
jgi:hypothetical protein